MRIVLFFCLALSSGAAWAQSGGEAGELSPEALDAAFSQDDAARVAAGFSHSIPHATPADPLGEMAAAVDLVFRGTVVSQAYEYDDRDIPYTRTTFSITETLRGDHPSNQIALVQPGGPARDDSQRVMMVSDARYFTVGEEEMLFMNLDPHSAIEARRASVVNRFRIFRDRVYNEDGYGVKVEPLPNGSYRLAINPRRHDEQRFRRIMIGSHRLEKRTVGEGQQPGSTLGMDLETFSEIIRR